MINLKNLKIDENLHKKIKIQAAKNDVQLGILAEALLEIGLENQKTIEKIIASRIATHAQNGTSKS